MTYMKIVGLFTKPLLFLHRGICCIVFCLANFATLFQNQYTCAKIIMLLFPSKWVSFLLLSIPVKFDFCLFLACKSIGNIVLSGSLPSDIMDNNV